MHCHLSVLPSCEDICVTDLPYLRYDGEDLLNRIPDKVAETALQHLANTLLNPILLTKLVLNPGF